jgi:hypothetical protein
MAAGADPVPHASTSADMPLVDQDDKEYNPINGNVKREFFHWGRINSNYLSLPGRRGPAMTG